MWVFRSCILMMFFDLVFCADPRLELQSLFGRDVTTAMRLINTSSDIIKNTERKIFRLNNIRLNYSNNAAFEIGYLTLSIQEKYRKMVDKYNTSRELFKLLYLIEHVLYLEEVEHHYWDLGHTYNMLHEIERKYRVTSGLDEIYDDWDIDGTGVKYKKEKTTTVKMIKIKQKNIANLEPSPPKKQNKNKWWPIDYGWEIDYEW